MNYKTKISVIMPILKDAEFLEESVNSLVNQTLDNFEIILITDTDNSLDILRDYAKKYESITVLTQKNLDPEKARNYGINEAKGDYVHFCDDSYIFESNFLEDMLKTIVINGSDVCYCSLPKGGRNKSRGLNLNSILSNPTFQNNWSEIIPHIFSSTFEVSGTIYKKSFLKNISQNTELLSDKSILQIKSILSTRKISFVDQFLVKYLTKDNAYYNSEQPYKVNDSLNIFKICDDIEDYLKEKSVYDKFKTYFDIYKINQISSFLDSVRYVGCYSYNNPKNRDLYANNSRVLDYSQYYGSKSKYLGLNYSFANKYFDKTKEEFEKLNYRDLRLIDLRSNEFSNKENLNKYVAVLKSENYLEYMEIANISNTEKLRTKNNGLIKKLNELKLKESEYNLDKNTSSENNLKEELNKLKSENKNLVDTNNQLREEYWEQRNKYDYILSSKSWKYTKWLRKE